VLPEDGSDQARVIWETADAVYSTYATYIESRAALARAMREARLSTSAHPRAKTALASRCDELSVVELDVSLALAAGDVAEQFGLRGYDALHLAAAIELEDPALIFVTWDGRLRQAALDAGLAVAP
jgi:predicted nucleic acid-binding protein